MEVDTGKPARGTDTPKPALSPLQAFILVGAIALAAGIFLVTRTEGPPAEARSNAAAPPATNALTPVTPTTPASTKASAKPQPTAMPLTPQRAIATFGRLRRLLDSAYARRDLGDIDEFAAPGSPIFAHATTQIRFLKRRSLLDRTLTKVTDLEVRAITPNQIKLVERVVIKPRYVDEATGLETDLDLTAERAILVWTLVRVDSGWHIYSAEKN